MPEVPRKALNMALALVIGVMGSLMAALGSDYFDRIFTAPQEKE